MAARALTALALLAASADSWCPWGCLLKRRIEQEGSAFIEQQGSESPDQRTEECSKLIEYCTAGTSDGAPRPGCDRFAEIVQKGSSDEDCDCDELATDMHGIFVAFVREIPHFEENEGTQEEDDAVQWEGEEEESLPAPELASFVG